MKRLCWFSCVIGLVMTMQHATVEALPNPYAPVTEPTIGPAPVPTMGQMFYLQLAVPPEVGVELDLPEGVKLLDKTKPREGVKQTRLYLRADHGIDDKITVRIAGREPAAMPLIVRTHREDIEHHIQQVPGIDPKVRKGGQSFFTAEMIAAGKANLVRFPDLAKSIGSPTPFDAMSDAELFDALPSWSMPVQCYSNWPCPICGDKIFRHSGFYPWKTQFDGKYKVQCPDCKKLFPTNNFTEDDFTSGDYPDDGWGYAAGDGSRDQRAGWVGYANHQTWQRLGAHVEKLAFRYLLNNDEDAAHRAAVLLCRLAYVYPGMNKRWQQVKSRYLRPGRLLIDGNWEREAVLVEAAYAYDAIFDYIDRDKKLVAFLQTKDPAIRSADNVKQLLDTYLIQVFGWDWMRRELSGGGMGSREKNMIQFAVAADMGAMSDRWIEEVFTHAWNTGLNKGGFVDENMINSRVREGPPVIAGVGYATGYLRHLSEMAEILSRVESPRWKKLTDLYDPVRYPKFRAEFEVWIDFLVAGQFAPGYGDGGGGKLHGIRYPTGLTYPGLTRWAYERAYRRWPTDRIARAIHQQGPRPRKLSGALGIGTPEVFEPDVWPEVVEQVKRVGPAPPLQSRVIDGFGFVMLESRPEAEKLEQRAGLSLRYGYSRGHSHQDNLNVEMYAFGFAMTPELGYPTWAHPCGSTSHVAHHITGMIDRSPQYTTGGIARGTLEMFSGAPGAPGCSFAEVSAKPQGFVNRDYRRAICLVDAPEGNVYVFDVMRLAGGKVRTNCFHGPPFDAFETSLEMKPTGEEHFEIDAIGRGLKNNILKPHVVATDGDFWADWKKQGHHLHLRYHAIGAAGRTYSSADYGKTDISPVKFLFAEDEGDDGESVFISIWEPYAGERFIEKIEREGNAVRVHLKGGRVDTLVYDNGFEFQSHEGGKPRVEHRVGRQEPFSTEITAVDYDARTIVLADVMPTDAELLLIRGGEHRTAYHVDKAIGSQVQLRHNAIIFQSRFDGVEDDGRTIVCELPLSLEAGRYFPPGYYNGATLTNETGDVYYRVVSVNDNRITVDRAVDTDAFADTDGDGRALVRIYDFGPGDTVTVHRSVFRRF